MGKASNIAKAQSASKAVKKQDVKKVRKIRTSVRFSKPHTRKLRSAPKTVKSIKAALTVTQQIPFDYNTVLIRPVAGDKNTQKMEKENTITFLVNANSNKFMIKQAFAKIYGMKVRSVRTLNTIKGDKKAYIRMKNDKDALGLATKIGIL